MISPTVAGFRLLFILSGESVNDGPQVDGEHPLIIQQWYLCVGVLQFVIRLLLHLPIGSRASQTDMDSSPATGIMKCINDPYLSLIQVIAFYSQRHDFLGTV